LIALAASAALALAACGGDDSDGDVAEVEAGDFAEGSTMAQLAEAGSITIGTKFDQPLFGLRGPSGDPEGFDVEIGKIIAGKLGIAPGDIDWVETQSAVREEFIEGGQVDIVIATYTINDDRKERIDFAGPYFNAEQMIMVRADEDEINGPDDLAGKRVCSVEGSTPAQNMRDTYPEAELDLFGAYTDCLEPLRNQQVDAVTTDSVILSGYVSESPDDFKIVGDGFSDEPYGIGLTKGDDEFRDFINDVLEEAYADGTWAAAFEDTAGQVLELIDPPAVDRY
jgi:glutamate transport system substrate-binding protein